MLCPPSHCGGSERTVLYPPQPSVLPSESPKSPHSPHICTHNLDWSSSSCHVMLCLSRAPSHCGSDGAVLSPTHHSPVCCHLSHQGHPTFAHTTWTATPPLISTLSLVLFVCDELVHLTLMLYLWHILSPLRALIAESVQIHCSTAWEEPPLLVQRSSSVWLCVCTTQCKANCILKCLVKLLLSWQLI